MRPTEMQEQRSSTGAVRAPRSGGRTAREEDRQADEGFARENGQKQDVLTFSVGGEEYALGISSIREIIKNRPITEVPRVPAFVAGIIAVRGVVMPVLDLRLRLRLLAAPLSQKARILVVTSPLGPAAAGSVGEAPSDTGELFGLLVDRVHHVVRLSEYDIEPPTMLTGHESDFVSGIGRLPEQDAEGRPEGGPFHRPGTQGTGLIPSRQRRMLILLDLSRVVAFEHAGSVGSQAVLAALPTSGPPVGSRLGSKERIW